MAKFQNLLDEVAEITGLDPLTADAGGGCAIQLDQIILNMQYMADTDQCYFCSRLFPIPSLNPERNTLFEKLLIANCFYRETSGGILGIDTGINAVTYATKFGIATVSANDFVTFIEQFINTAEQLVEKFNTVVPAGGNNTSVKSEDFNSYLRV